MSVLCPYCQHKLRVKGAHAGKFLPTCGRCEGTFMLVIPADPDSPMLITPLDERRRKIKHGLFSAPLPDSEGAAIP